MKSKQYYRNEPTVQFSQVPCLKTKSSGKPPNDHQILEIFLRKLENVLFDIYKKQQTYSNFNGEESHGRNRVTEKTDKESCVVVWNRNDYIVDAGKQLSDANVQKGVKCNVKLMQYLAEPSNKMFKSLKNGGFITDKKLKYFTFDHKGVCNSRNLYFFSKIHKRLFNVPGPPVISNCGIPTEKALSFQIVIVKLSCKKAGPT